MTHIFKTDSYENVLSDLNMAIEWLKQHESKIEPTRINRYKKVLRLLLDAYKRGTTQKLLHKVGFPKIASSFYEIREIIDIWTGLKNVESEELRIRLKKFVKGPENIADELTRTSSNYPRNIGFELYMGSRFAASDFDVTFTSDGDISIVYQEKPIYIECKRPNRLNKLKKNINEAFVQLETKYKVGDNDAVGLIALSINKLINPEQKLLVTNNLDSLSDYLSKLVEKFIRDYEYQWQGRNEKRTIGIVVALQTPCIIENQNLLTISRDLGVNNTTIPGTKDHNLLMNIAEKLRKATYFF